jgi:DNA-binding transcriptional ArsR family regulator
LTTVNFADIPNPFLMDARRTSLDEALHAIADPTRRRILQALKEHNASSADGGSKEKTAGLCAGNIEEYVQLSQPTISHHMAILTNAGMVEAVKQGQWRWYRRNEKALRRLVKSLRAQL